MGRFSESMEKELFMKTPTERMSWLKTNLKDVLQARHQELTNNAASFRNKQCRSKGLELWKLAFRVSRKSNTRMLEDCLRHVFSTWKDMTHSRAFEQELLNQEMREEVIRLRQENNEMKQTLQMLVTKLEEKDSAQTAARKAERAKDKEEAAVNLAGTVVSLETTFKKRVVSIGCRVKSLAAFKDIEQIGDTGTIVSIKRNEDGRYMMHCVIDRNGKQVNSDVKFWTQYYEILP